MKIRTVILLVGALLIAVFVALNLEEILRPTSINLGLTQIQAPMGLVLLGLLVMGLCFFLVAMMFIQTGHLLALRQLNKEAKEQRGLADSAEQSRFTELRQMLQAQDKAHQQMAQSHQDEQLARLAKLEDQLITQLEESHNGLAASIGEMEDRIERQVQGVSVKLLN